MPDEVTAVDLWPRFSRFGRVGEVYIPNKVDKQGKRFGFVKFREVRDEVELLRMLSNIWFGTFKLGINLSKFKRRAEPAQVEVEQSTDVKGKRVQGGKTFKNVLVEEGVSGEGGRRTGASVEGGSSTQGELQHTTEVVWEVDVEDERVTN
jgi:RNA recognition motif-containing protein